MARGSAAASQPSNGALPVKAETTPASTLPASTDYSDPNAMAIAPYVPPTSLFQDFNLPFAGTDSSNGLWDFDGTGGAGIPFVSGAQLEGQHNSSMQNGGGMPSTSIEDASENAGSHATGSQIPTHIAKNNPFLNKLRR